MGSSSQSLDDHGYVYNILTMIIKRNLGRYDGLSYRPHEKSGAVDSRCGTPYGV
jgi:hypothetical protein